MTIPLDTAKKNIIEALNNFDRDLGRRAADILYNEERTNIVEQQPQTNMMQCRQAGTTIDDVKARDMHLPNFEQTFGPHFTRQDNPEDYAIIDYEYHGTPYSLEYLAHELGHAIADDIQIEHGRSFRDFSQDQLEQQAYFVQKIAMEAIFPSTAHHETEQLKPSFERAKQMNAAHKVYEKTLSAGPHQRPNMILEVMGGNASPDMPTSSPSSKTASMQQSR